MKKNDGKEFEKLVENVMSAFANPETTVERDIKIPTEFGLRQFDVVITTIVEPIGEIRVGIECRDHKSKASIKQIDEFVSKLQDCSIINKGIIVNRKGFSSNAKKKALRNGIGLYTLTNDINRFKENVFNIPIIIVEHRVINSILEGQIIVEEETKMNRHGQHMVNKIPFNKFIIQDFYKRQEGKEVDSKSTRQFSIKGIQSVGIDSVHFPVQPDTSINYVVDTKIYFGHIDEANSVRFLKDELSSDDKILINSETLLENFNFRNWSSFDSIQDTPPNLGILNVISLTVTRSGYSLPSLGINENYKIRTSRQAST